MKHVAVIPARGGSKRIPRKNVKPFLDKPMMAWPIELAISSGIFDTVLVSTDDQEIAQIAKNHGAIVPFVRPPHLSNDMVGTRPVIKHAIEHLLEAGQSPHTVCCIYPCTPLLTEDILRAALDQLEASEGDHFVFPIVEFASPIERALRLSDAGYTIPDAPAKTHARTQDLAPAFYDGGQFYWARPATWLGPREVFDGGIPIIIGPDRIVDIDTLDDWTRAEKIAKSRP